MDVVVSREAMMLRGHLLLLLLSKPIQTASSPCSPMRLILGMLIMMMVLLMVIRDAVVVLLMVIRRTPVVLLPVVLVLLSLFETMVVVVFLMVMLLLRFLPWLTRHGRSRAYIFLQRIILGCTRIVPTTGTTAVTCLGDIAFENLTLL